jgi:hypothetical protein
MNHALQNEEVELWHVEVAPNDVRVLTLEQLDEAFQRGLVNERTRVFQDGMDEPAFLGELLGLDDSDDEEQEEPVAAAPPPAPEPKRIHQQTLVGLHAEQPRSAPPQSRAGQPAYPPPAQQSGVRPVHSAPPPMSSQRPQGPYANAGYPQSAPPAQPRRAAVAAEGAWPPVVSRAAAQPSAPPPSGTNPSTITGVVAPSVVPMAMDLGASDDFEYPQRKGKGKIVLAAVGVLAVAAGVALAVTGQGASLLGSITASAAPAPVEKPKPIVDTKSHAYDPGSAPVKLKEDAPAPVVITTRENEADQLKAAGMTADTAAKASDKTDKSSLLTKPSKKAAAVSSKRAKSSGGGAPHRGGGGGGAPKGPFHAGGDTHDPLNGSL